MSSRSPCWTRWIPRVTSSAIARSVSSKDFGLSSSLMAAIIAPQPAREIKALSATFDLDVATACSRADAPPATASP